MFHFNKEDVYIGYSIEEFTKVKDALENEGVKYSYKIVNRQGQWSRRGTRRGSYGSFGIDMDYEKQYIVYVHRKNLEKAKYLVNSALHR